MTKAKKEDGAVDGVISVRVLQDCQVGKAGQVVEVEAALLPGLKDSALVDDHPDAVEYAKSLIKAEDGSANDAAIQ